MSRFTVKTIATISTTALLGMCVLAQANPPAKPATTPSKPATTQSKPAGTQTKPAGTAAKAAVSAYDKALLTPAALKAQAPPEFDVKFVTTKGDFIIHVTRDWAPIGADRFYNLAKHHYFDGCAFFRVIPGFVAQFGINPYPVVAKAWDSAKIKDDPVKHHNTIGTVVYAAEQAKNTRTTQLFINYRDNTQSLDPQGFAPFGEVTTGMDVVTKFYSGYGGDLDQEAITNGGKAYIDSKYPQMDSIKTATVIAPAATPTKPGQ